MYIYTYIYIYLFIGPPVYQCGEHWSGGPGSLVRGAKEKLSIPPIGCPQNLSSKSVRKICCPQDLSAKSVRKILSAISTSGTGKFVATLITRRGEPGLTPKFTSSNRATESTSYSYKKKMAPKRNLFFQSRCQGARVQTSRPVDIEPPSG